MSGTVTVTFRYPKRIHTKTVQLDSEELCRTRESIFCSLLRKICLQLKLSNNGSGYFYMVMNWQLPEVFKDTINISGGKPKQKEKENRGKQKVLSSSNIARY